MRLLFLLFLILQSAIGIPKLEAAHARVLYDVDNLALVPTNLISSIVLQQSRWAVNTLSPHSDATNYVVNFPASENLLNVSGPVHFLHSTNRSGSTATNIFASVLLKNTSGSTRTLSFNANWIFLSATPTDIPNNTSARLDIISAGAAETDVFALFSPQGGFVGSGSGDVTTAQLNAASNVLRSDITTLQGATNGLHTRMGNAESATNLIGAKQFGSALLTNLGIIPPFTNFSIAAASDGQVLKYVSANARWENGTDATGGGGGGSLITNENQFGASVTLTIKNGARLTNLVVHDFLTLTNSGTPATPVTNNLVVGKDSYAGRGILESWDDNGLSIAYQPALFNNRITMFQPSATTVIGSYGLTVPVNLGGVTVSHPPPTEQWPYAVQLATPATSNACAGTFSSIDMTTMGTRYGLNGYFLATEFLTTNRLVQHTLTAPAGNRLFIGRTSTASPNLTNIVNTTNGTGQYIGLYCDSGHTNQFYLTARDGTAEFRTNTGIFYVATNLYQFYLMQAPTSKFAAWKLRDLTSNTVAQGWFSNNVPTNMMKFGYLIRNGTTVVNSVRFTKLYVEAPLSP